MFPILCRLMECSICADLRPSDDEEEFGHALDTLPGDTIRMGWGEPTSTKVEAAELDAELTTEAFELLMRGGCNKLSWKAHEACRVACTSLAWNHPNE